MIEYERCSSDSGRERKTERETSSCRDETLSTDDGDDEEQRRFAPPFCHARSEGKESRSVSRKKKITTI